MGEERTPQPTPKRGLPGRARRAVATVVDGAEAVIEGARDTWQERPGARVRRVRRLGSQPLPYLMDVHPEARNARPVQVGVRSIDVDDIGGTAVGGGDQRGGCLLYTSDAADE